MKGIKKVRQSVAVYGSLVTITAVQMFSGVAHASVGIEKWAQDYKPSPSYSASGAPIKITEDNNGNTYTADSFYDTTNGLYMIALVKYDSNGVKQWATMYGSFSSTAAVQGLAYKNGNVYLTTDGANTGSTAVTYNTLKYSDDGNLQWSTSYANVNARSFYGADNSYLSVSSDGSVYITGSDGSSDLTIKYDSSGNQSWASRYVVGSGSSVDVTIGVATDSLGNVYMFGFTNDSQTQQDYLVVKYDANGEQEWVKNYDSGGTDIAQNFYIDADDNLYVTGYTQAYSTDGYPQSMVTVKLDSSGNMQWVNTYKESSGVIAGVSVRTNTSGNVYVAGTDSRPGHDTQVLLSLSTSGNQQWVSHNDDGSQASSAGLATANDGSLYLAGSGFKDYRNYYLLSKYDSNGNLQWSTRHDNGTGGVVRGIVLQNSAVYVTGYTCDSTSCQLTTAKFLNDTAPTITAVILPVPNSNGWNNSNVTVSFNCVDIDSDLSSCTNPINLSNEGAQRVNGVAVDNAGNQASLTKIVKIDKTAPTISYTVSPAPNVAGWNNSNATVTFTCADTLSGIQNCSQPVTVSTEGSNQTVVGNTTDLASNTMTATATIKLDKSAPTVSGPTMSNTFFLFGGSATIGANAADTLSGVVSGEYYIDTDPGKGSGTALTYSNGKVGGTATIPNNLSFGQHKLYIRSKDTAGNWSSTVSLTFTFI